MLINVIYHEWDIETIVEHVPKQATGARRGKMVIKRMISNDQKLAPSGKRLFKIDYNYCHMLLDHS